MNFEIRATDRAVYGQSINQNITIQLIIDESGDEELRDPEGRTAQVIRLPIIKIQTIIDESGDEELRDPEGTPLVIQTPIKIQQIIDESGDEELRDPEGTPMVVIQIPVIRKLIDESGDEELRDPEGYTEYDDTELYYDEFEGEEDLYPENAPSIIIQLPIDIQTLIDESGDEELRDPEGTPELNNPETFIIDESGDEELRDPEGVQQTVITIRTTRRTHRY